MKVETSTLTDQIQTDIVFLKIDVEGHEMAVLLGMEGFLQAHTVDFIMMEHNPPRGSWAKGGPCLGGLLASTRKEF